MCERCFEVSRRVMLKGVVAAGLGAMVVGCDKDNRETELPDPIPVYQDHVMIGEGGGPPVPVRINPKEIKVPPPTPPQPSDYGEILPRKAWSHLPLQLARGRPMDGVQRITVHHSGDGKTFVDTSIAGVARHLQIVQQAHLQRGMVDIAYHFAVDGAGRVWQLRWLSYEGQHVRIGKNGVRWNEHNVGIVALGDFNIQKPTAAQRDRLFALVRLVQKKYVTPHSTIKMHDELVQTDCPGKYMMPYIRDARAKGLL